MPNSSAAGMDRRAPPSSSLFRGAAARVSAFWTSAGHTSDTNHSHLVCAACDESVPAHAIDAAGVGHD
eukprot:236595-Pleurochrysis_carterae.AAC.1